MPMRTGNMKVEFSPKILDRIADDMLTEYMKIEMFRILLKHPYQRQPSFAAKALLTMASNVTIADVYEVPSAVKKQMSGAELKLPSGLCFEEYYNLLLQNTAPNSGKSGDEPQKTDSGSVAGKLQGLIKASLKVDMDYRKMLSLFKTSVISSRRRLTRMRPNRRSGFDAMGSRYELSTNLLIAVDVSGSVTDRSLQFFFSVINRLFKYGVEKLDVLQFDAQIQGEIEPLKKARKTVKIMGRGGTSFQPAADYYCEHPEYDGLIYFTDGYAPPPKFNTKRPIDVLWVLCSRQCYMANSAWIRKIKRNRVTFIPRSE